MAFLDTENTDIFAQTVTGLRGESVELEGNACITGSGLGSSYISTDGVGAIKRSISVHEPASNHCLIPNRHPAYRISRADWKMVPASEILHQLYALEPSSPDFLRVLYAWLKTDEDEQYSRGLEGGELSRLVEFLDSVCPLSPTPSLPQTRFSRPWASFQPLMTSTGNVCASYEPSAAII